MVFVVIKYVSSAELPRDDVDPIWTGIEFRNINRPPLAKMDIRMGPSV